MQRVGEGGGGGEGWREQGKKEEEEETFREVEITFGWVWAQLAVAGYGG